MLALLWYKTYLFLIQNNCDKHYEYLLSAIQIVFKTHRFICMIAYCLEYWMFLLVCLLHAFFKFQCTCNFHMYMRTIKVILILILILILKWHTCSCPKCQNFKCLSLSLSLLSLSLSQVRAQHLYNCPSFFKHVIYV